MEDFDKIYGLVHSDIFNIASFSYSNIKKQASVVNEKVMNMFAEACIKSYATDSMYSPFRQHPELVMYVRDENLKVVGVARKGFYNVIGHKENNYIWYEIEPNRFVALVNGRVRYIPADNEVEILRSKLERIKKIIEE